MAANCSAPLRLIHRATATTWAQRSRLPLKRQITHQNNATRSYSLAASTMTTASSDTRRTVDNVSSNSLFQRPPFYPPHHHATNSSIGRARTMVMITKTKSTDEDVEKTINITSPANNNDAIDPNNVQAGEIGITASCAARIRQLASTRPDPDAVYLRLYVDAGGCSGFQYKFLLLSEDNNNNNNDAPEDDDEEDGTIDPEEDVIFLKDGMRVVVDQTSLDLLEGSTIDYVQEMIRSSFAVVANPQSESACGCGSSFAVKNFEANPALD